MKKEQININKIVKVEDNEITVLDYAFKYKDGMKGLTGTKFEIISKDYFDEIKEPYLNDDKETLIYLAENFGELNREMIEGVDSSEEGLTELFFDTSHSELWNYLREELGLNEDEAYIFNCVGGGRCFEPTDKFTHNIELEKYLEWEK